MIFDLSSLIKPPAIALALLLLLECGHPRLLNASQASGLNPPENNGGRQAPPVLTGIDVLQAGDFKPLWGKKIGVLTNLSSVNRKGVPTLDVLLSSPKVRVAAVFSPEHGLDLQAQNGIAVSSGRDEKRRLEVYSLYGEHSRPTQKQLKGLDLLVVDLPDVGTRFYTYSATAAQCMEEAAKAKLPVLLLDRPNPINGANIEGPVLKPADYSLTGYASLPVRHGFTLGELALFMNREKKIGADLKIIKIRGWRRAMWFDDTRLPWMNPSPNLRSLAEATLYPCLCLLEPTNLSLGRGTDNPFERFGAPWISSQEARKLSQNLNGRKLPGVRFDPISFTPKSSVFEGKECGGCRVSLTDRGAFRPVLTGLHITDALVRICGKRFKLGEMDVLLRAPKVRQAIQDGVSMKEVVKMYEGEEKKFRELRRKYLIYQ